MAHFNWLLISTSSTRCGKNYKNQAFGDNSRRETITTVPTVQGARSFIDNIQCAEQTKEPFDLIKLSI